VKGLFTYTQARARFVEAVSAAGGGVVQSILSPSQGPSGEPLFVDVARVGPSEASRRLVLLSGVHDVEGLCGSMLQSTFLEAGLIPAIAPDRPLACSSAMARRAGRCCRSCGRRNRAARLSRYGRCGRVLRSLRGSFGWRGLARLCNQGLCFGRRSSSFPEPFLTSPCLWRRVSTRHLVGHVVRVGFRPCRFYHPTCGIHACIRMARIQIVRPARIVVRASRSGRRTVAWLGYSPSSGVGR